MSVVFLVVTRPAALFGAFDWQLDCVRYKSWFAWISARRYDRNLFLVEQNLDTSYVKLLVFSHFHYLFDCQTWCSAWFIRRVVSTVEWPQLICTWFSLSCEEPALLRRLWETSGRQTWKYLAVLHSTRAEAAWVIWIVEFVFVTEAFCNGGILITAPLGHLCFCFGWKGSIVAKLFASNWLCAD